MLLIKAVVIQHPLDQDFFRIKSQFNRIRKNFFKLTKEMAEDYRELMLTLQQVTPNNDYSQEAYFIYHNNMALGKRTFDPKQHFPATAAEMEVLLKTIREDVEIAREHRNLAFYSRDEYFQINQQHLRQDQTLDDEMAEAIGNFSFE